VNSEIGLETENNTVLKYLAAKEFFSWLVPLIMLGAGLLGAVVLVVEGEAAFGTSDAVPWGLLIAGYVLLAVTTSGICLVSSLGHVFGFERFEVISQRAIFLGILILLAAFGVLAVELGHPFRLVYVILSPNFTSGIWWMGVIYGIYLVVLMLELFLMFLGRHTWARTAGIVTVILAVAATTNLGSVFGLVNARPFWYGPYWPVYVLITALLSGTAALMVLSGVLRQGASRQKSPAFAYRLGKLGNSLSKILLGLVTLAAVMTVWKIISSLYGGVVPQQRAALALVEGPLAVPFWGFEIGLGMILPVLLIVFGRGNGRWQFLAAVAVLAGLVFMRYDMVVGGQIVPASTMAGSGFWGYLGYLPSSYEIMVMVGALGFIILAYRLGERYLLPLFPGD